MGYRDKILKQLYEVLENNTSDARIYYRLADRCNRSSLKYFFKKLSLQKRLFCRRLNYEIRELEKEMEFIGENNIFQYESSTKKSFEGIPTSRGDISGLVAYCYNQEQQYLEQYKTLLSKTYLGGIREMLLSQKHSIQLILNEIRSLETKMHNLKNEGEINYS